MDARFPASAASTDPPLAELPQPLTSFVGRERELSIVAALVRRPDVRLVTITGAGGAGKTRLALRAAAACRDAFEHVIFVPLDPVRDPARLLPTVAQHLGVPDAPGQTLTARLHARLRDRRLLLVLDNLEHLLEAMPAVADLLGAGPELTILATCRTTLQLTGEHRLPLEPLAPSEAQALFIERARALHPAFVPSSEQAPIIEAICDRLDRLPLAIELAASRVSVLPPRALLTRLEHRLDLLTNGPHDAPPRLRNMRDTIAWSHDLLPADQQRLFRRIGVFNGGFTLEAVEAIAGDDTDSLEALAGLISASLVQPTQGVADASRYAMLETIREYALERLAAAGETADLRARHARYYCQLANDALPDYDGPDNRLAADRIDIEMDNCRAAMAWALEDQAAEIGLMLAGALGRIWWYAQATAGRPWVERIAEGLMWIERMLPMRDGLPVDVVTEALVGASSLSWMSGDMNRAEVLAAELVARARDEGYPYGLFWGRCQLGVLAWKQRDTATARTHAEAMLDLAPAMRNADNHACIAHHSLGLIAFAEDDFERAATHLEEALRLTHRTGNEWLLAQISAALGRAQFEQGDLRRAVPLMRDGLVAYRSQRNRFEMHASLVDLARLALVVDQPDRAARLLGHAATYPFHEDESPGTYSRREGEVPETPRIGDIARIRLGDAAYAAERQAGGVLTWEGVLAEVEALHEATAETRPVQQPDTAAEHGLTSRELEVLRLVAAGQSSREIAGVLSVSQRTVESHIAHILDKLGATSRTAAAVLAVRRGML